MQKAETPAMFTEIASRYDLLNHVLSFNVDRLWRRQLIQLAELPDDGHVLDACTGTADVAIGFARAHTGATVVGLDRSPGMLAVGRKKLDKGGLAERVRLYEGDVLDLPFADGTFDAVTIAFGLRNLPDYSRGVGEMCRVLKPGGRLLVLDFSPPQRGMVLTAYRFYLQNVLPFIGGLVSGSRKAYRYLASSIGDFLPRDATFALMSEFGLRDLSARKLTGGVAYIYRGVKPD
jgi:demethylmenaquinone methyltransferase/2-methoxy-6-polyprenyl-1,4-benzoquinol methylase